MRVRFTRQANAQLASILTYLRERNPRAAGRVAAQVEGMCGSIAASPGLGRAQDIEGVRRRVVQPGGYLIYYSVDGEQQLVTILAISHPSQQRVYRDG